MEAEADWAETKTILQEVEKLFQSEDDIRDVDEIHKMKNEIGKCLKYTILCVHLLTIVQFFLNMYDFLICVLATRTYCFLTS